jgi:hypothetical protein
MKQAFSAQLPPADDSLTTNNNNDDERITTRVLQLQYTIM